MWAMPLQDAEPVLNRVQPRGVGGVEVRVGMDLLQLLPHDLLVGRRVDRKPAVAGAVFQTCQTLCQLAGAPDGNHVVGGTDGHAHGYQGPALGHAQQYASTLHLDLAVGQRLRPRLPLQDRAVFCPKGQSAGLCHERPLGSSRCQMTTMYSSVIVH